MELRDAQTLAAISKWTESSETSDVSDHWLVGSCGELAELCVRGLDQSWQPLRTLGKDIRVDFKHGTPVAFASDDTFVVGRFQLAVATVQGALLFRAELPKDRTVIRVRSSGGDRFAVIEDRMRGLRNEALDMYPFQADDSVVVYSISRRRAVYALKLEGGSPWSPWNIHDNDVAVSPDGALLAVISDATLQVYRLPQ